MKPYGHTVSSVDCDSNRAAEKSSDPAGMHCFSIKTLLMHFVVYDVTYDIIYKFMNVLCTVQAVGRKQRHKGRQDIDIHLLKPNRFHAQPLPQHMPEHYLVYGE